MLWNSKKKLIYHAAERNKEPILSVLRQHITNTPDQRLLEIASGSGQHIAFFAPNFPNVLFYPSEYNESGLMESISAYTCSLTNVKPPLTIDVRTDGETWGNGFFKENKLDYIYNSNLIHISPFECAIGLFRAAGKVLKPGGILFTYGPYAVDGKLIPESNVNFDKSLRSQNSEWGVRDIRDLKKLASENFIILDKMVDMPSENKILIWKKSSH